MRIQSCTYYWFYWIFHIMIWCSWLIWRLHHGNEYPPCTYFTIGNAQDKQQYLLGQYNWWCNGTACKAWFTFVMVFERLPEGEFNRQFLECVLRKSSFQGETLMIQAGGSFFGYNPILKALKNAPLPLARYFTSKTLPPEASSKMDVAPPQYLVGKGDEFDLSCLAESG